MAGSTTSSTAWIVDVVLCLPYLFLVLMIVAFFGIRDIRVIVFAIAVRRLDDGRETRARGVPVHLREMDFVAAAKALGAALTAHHRPPHDAGRHGAARRGLLPWASPTSLIIGESALSFLGFGIAPPQVSLGQMLQGYKEYFYDHPERICIWALCWSPSSCVRASSPTASATPLTRASESNSRPRDPEHATPPTEATGPGITSSRSAGSRRTSSPRTGR